jgi:hypothetical protein
MRWFALLFVFIVNCGSHRVVGSNDNSSVFIRLPDGGFGFQDGGIALPDDGIPTCDNVVQRVPMQPQAHIGSPPNYTNAVPRYLSNPPTAGEHYPIWASYSIHAEVVPRGYWVHNLEHGAIVFLYRPDAPQDVVDALKRVYSQIPLEADCVAQGVRHNRVLLTPDPLLDVPWAVTVSQPGNPNPPLGDGFVIKDYCIKSEQALVNFAMTYRNQSAETLCDDGIGPPYL